MKIRPMSDLHIEFHRDNGKSFFESLLPPVDNEVLILAGDISVGDKSNKWSHVNNFRAKFTDSVIIPGNHEYYTGKKTPDNNSHIYNIQGRRILACTLWTPEYPDNILYEKNMTDFELIKKARHIYQINAAQVEWLTNNIQEGDVVVTHHAPSYRSVHEKYYGDPMNRFYANNLDELILTTKPALICHGHMHDSNDYYIGNTRVVCNPLGYPHELNPSFNGNLIIEI